MNIQYILFFHPCWIHSFCLVNRVTWENVIIFAFHELKTLNLIWCCISSTLFKILHIKYLGLWRTYKNPILDDICYVCTDFKNFLELCLL